MSQEAPRPQHLLNPHLLNLQGYEPIVPLEVLSARLGIPMEHIIKLDGNENPYGPSPRVAQALAAYQGYHIYPDSLMADLREDLADYVGVGPDHLAIGAGSDELIDLVLRLFVGLGDRVINLVPSFGMYRFSTEALGGVAVPVPRREDFSLDLSAVKAAVDNSTKIIFLANPNNPTGNLASSEEVAALLEMGPIVVVDEAYYEFAGETVAPWVSRYDNLVVLRTFSKWAGLAGLRVGYGAFPTWMMDYLFRLKPPYDVSVAAQIALRESLTDRDYLLATVRLIIAEREVLYQQLGQVPGLRVYPSQANFILCGCPPGQARRIKEALERQSILIRYFDTALLRDFIRISVGKPEHTEAVIAALKEEVTRGD